MIFHVDMSHLYHQPRYSVISLVSVNEDYIFNKKIEKALVLCDPFRQELIKKYEIKKVHAANICLLIEFCGQIDKIVICSDVKPTEGVFPYIEFLRKDLKGKIMSIEFLRKLKKDHKLKSEADAFAKRVARNFPKQKYMHRKLKIFEKVIILPEDKSNLEKLEKLLKR